VGFHKMSSSNARFRALQRPNLDSLIVTRSVHECSLLSRPSCRQGSHSVCRNRFCGSLDSGAKRNAVKRSGFERPFRTRQSRLGKIQALDRTQPGRAGTALDRNLIVWAALLRSAFSSRKLECAIYGDVLATSTRCRPIAFVGGFPAYGSPVGGFVIETVSPITRPCEARTGQR